MKFRIAGTAADQFLPEFSRLQEVLLQLLYWLRRRADASLDMMRRLFYFAVQPVLCAWHMQYNCKSIKCQVLNELRVSSMRRICMAVDDAFVV